MQHYVYCLRPDEAENVHFGLENGSHADNIIISNYIKVRPKASRAGFVCRTDQYFQSQRLTYKRRVRISIYVQNECGKLSISAWPWGGTLYSKAGYIDAGKRVCTRTAGNHPTLHGNRLIQTYAFSVRAVRTGAYGCKNTPVLPGSTYGPDVRVVCIELYRQEAYCN